MPIKVGGENSISVARVGTLGGADLVAARFGSGATAPHSHCDVEIGVLEAGQRLIGCRRRTYRVPTGAVVVFNPGEIHAGTSLDNAGSSYRSFLIPPATLRASCHWLAGSGDSSLPWFESPVVHDPRLAKELLQSHIAIADQGSGSNTDTRVAEVLAELARRHSRPAPPEPPVDEIAATVHRIQRYLEDNHRTKIRLSALAEMAGVSVFRLIRAFRAATGLPPYAYLEQVRIHRAARLLREGHPVSRVALLTGFADQSHLTRLFKRLIGVPPGRYQRSRLAANVGTR